MRNPITRLVLIATALVLAVGVGGCSDSKKDAAPTGTGPAATTPGGGLEQGDAEACRDFARQFASVSLIGNAASDPNALEQATAAIDEMKAEMPDDLAAKVETLKQVYTAMATDPTAAVQRLNDPEVKQAMTDVTAWISAGCKT